jgi:predicted lactoylglutathione lyase
MATTKPRKLIVNLPVRDLSRSVAFFTKLGFSFDPRLTDAKGACMVISDDALVMLLTQTRFKDFTKKQICDTKFHTESLFVLSTSSRAELEALVKTALTEGGSPATEPVDGGARYSHSFYDPDGHHWEVMYMEQAVAA